MNTPRRLMMGRDMLFIQMRLLHVTWMLMQVGTLQDTAAAVVDHGDEADGDIRISTMTTRA